MVLTFLNLVLVSGILTGLPAGAILAYNHQYSGDVLLQNLPTKRYIEQSTGIIGEIQSFPEVVAVSARYIEEGRVEANYKTATGPNMLPDSAPSEITGINVRDEDRVTGLGAQMLEGEMLAPGEEGYVVIGKNLLSQYSVGGIISAKTLKNVRTGDKVRISVDGHVNEFIVKGVLGSKVDQVSQRVWMEGSELKKLIGRNDNNVDEIAVRLRSGVSADMVVSELTALGVDKNAKIQTAREAVGSFLDQIERTFLILSSLIGGVGIVVASITVFIVVFINAVTRRKYIGILKGIGISAAAIELSYVIQSIFYAVVGSVIGLAVTYSLLQPYYFAHPINLPFADGILVVPYLGTFLKSGVLVVITIIAGYFPARLIVSKNTLDSILGR
jgi:ABC-type lipoprotein release transport system permease subunit